MDLEHLNILKLELHEAKTEVQQVSQELECKKLYIEALEMAILQLESIKEIEERLKRCQEDRKMDAEIINSWKLAANEKSVMIEDLKSRTEQLSQEVIKLRRGETRTE